LFDKTNRLYVLYRHTHVVSSQPFTNPTNLIPRVPTYLPTLDGASIQVKNVVDCGTASAAAITQAVVPNRGIGGVGGVVAARGGGNIAKAQSETLFS